MKKINNYFASLFLVIAMPLSAAFAQDSFSSATSANTDLLAAVGAMRMSHLDLTVYIPAAIESQIVRTDYENQSIFSLKTGNEAAAFLFSVTKVTGDQWMKTKDQLEGCTIIENKDGFITFAQKTDVKKIKGAADVQYQQVLAQVDAMIRSIGVR